MKRELGIARCGLACCLCSENIACKALWLIGEMVLIYPLSGCDQDGNSEIMLTGVKQA